MRKFGITGLVCLILLVMASCSQDERACTEEFVMLTVTVKDTLNRPVVLDDYFVLEEATGDTLDLSSTDPWMDSVNRQEGRYFLLTDAQFGLTAARGRDFSFMGFLDTNRVAHRVYRIGNDACHVVLLAGNPIITIELSKNKQ